MDDGAADSTARAGDDTGGVVVPATVRPDPPKLGRYRIGDRLGAGGMGVVYLAYDPVLDRQVAIKVLRKSDRDRGLLEREAQAIARIHHPNVVVVHDVVADGSDVCVVMQYVRGTTLAEWLSAGERPPREILARFIAAGRGLAAAHAAGLVHRDFKPENVLLGDDGTVVVTDFGLARLDATPRDDVESPDEETQLAQTRSGSLSGTPRYMSPEQFRGELIEARSDQFNFAVALWLALFKRHPLIPPGAAPNLEEHRALVLQGTILPPRDPRVVPSRITAALRRALTVDPRARFASMEQFLAELAPRHRGRVLAFAGAGAVAAGVALVVVTGRGGDARSGVTASAASCDRAGAPIALAWSAEARKRYVTRASEGPDGVELTKIVAADAARFDAFAAAWTEVASADCRAPDPRRAACLVDQREQLVAALVRPKLGRQPILGDPRWCASGGVHLRETVLRTAKGSAAFSPDGQQIVYATEDGARSIIGLDGRAVGTGPAMTAIEEWMADGIVGRDEHQKRVRALPGASPVPIVEPPGVASNKGDRRARLGGGGIEIVDGAGAVLSTIRVDGASDVGEWSPDDRRIVVNLFRHLAIVDLASGRVEPLSRLTHHALGYASYEWRGPDELLVSGSAIEGLGDGLWLVRLDDEGAIRGFAAVVPPVRNRGLAVSDAAGERVLVERTQLSFATVRVQGNIGTPMPAPVEGTLVGADAVHGRFVIRTDDGSRHLVDAAGNLLDGSLLPTDGRITCSALASTRCVEMTMRGGKVRLQPSGPDGPGQAVSFSPTYLSGMALSADGRRVVITSNRHALQIWDLATGDSRIIDVPDCRVQHAVFAARGADVIIAGICGRAYQLRTVDARGRTKLMFTSDDWISGLDHWRDGALVITTRGFRGELVLLEGLPPP